MMINKLAKKDLFAIAFGSVIGSGAFILPGNFFLEDAGLVNTFIGFSIAIVIIIIIEKSYSIMMSKYQQAGGAYCFAKYTFGKKIGFATGWLLLLAYVAMIPLNATAIPMVLEKVLPFYTRGIMLYDIYGYDIYSNDLIISIAAILIFTWINYKGVTSSKNIQNLCVLGLILGVTSLSFFTIINFDSQAHQNILSNSTDIDMSAIIKIVAFAPWAFIGFDTISQMSGEYDVKPKVASNTAMLAVVMGALVYNVLNIITAAGVNANDLDQSSWATGEAASNIAGHIALIVTGIAIFGAVISGLNGFFMSSTRVITAMTNDLVDKSHHSKLGEVPKKVIIFVSFITILVPFVGRNALEWLVDLASVGASFAYLMTCCSAYLTTKNKANKVFTILGIGASILFLVILLTPIFHANIPLVAGYMLIAWLILGGFVFSIFRIPQGFKKRMATIQS